MSDGKTNSSTEQTATNSSTEQIATNSSTEQTATNNPNNESTTKGANDNDEEYVSTMKVTCKTCRSEVNLTADDFEREPRYFGKDPMTFAFMCPICKRVDFKGYHELPVKVIQEYYDKNGK